MIPKSKFHGVVFQSNVGKWRAYIYKERKRKHLGYFEKEKDAALAYNKEARKVFFGEKLNKV